MGESNPYRWKPTPEFERALSADKRLRVVQRVVTHMTMYVRPTDSFCYGCAWENMIKPLLLPLVGDGRRVPAKRTASESATEDWLRTSQAYHVVAQVLLGRLWEADPGNGCGFERHDAKVDA